MTPVRCFERAIAGYAVGQVKPAAAFVMRCPWLLSRPPLARSGPGGLVRPAMATRDARPLPVQADRAAIVRRMPHPGVARRAAMWKSAPCYAACVHYQLLRLCRDLP